MHVAARAESKGIGGIKPDRLLDIAQTPIDIAGLAIGFAAKYEGFDEIFSGAGFDRPGASRDLLVPWDIGLAGTFWVQHGLGSNLNCEQHERQRQN